MKLLVVFQFVSSIIFPIVASQSETPPELEEEYELLEGKVKRQTTVNYCGDETPIKWNGLSPNGDKPNEPVINMVRNAGYSASVYDAETKDGYILTMYRIFKNEPTRGTPVLLMHGLLSAPSNWLVLDKDKALPYKLVEDGKDVWLGANRGSTESRRHRNFTEDDPKFWGFSIVEQGLYDVPAFMDKIQEVTKQEEIFYIGHSYGTKQYFIHMSEFPGNCSRVKAMWALAPVTYLTNTKTPLAKLFSPLGHLRNSADSLGRKRFEIGDAKTRNISTALCKAKVSCRACQSVMYLLIGFSPQQYSHVWEPAVLGHYPDSTSVQMGIDLEQSIKNDRFGYTDFGIAGNTRRYGEKYAKTPPTFDLGKMGKNPQCKVHLAYSANDILAAPEDVLRTWDELGPAVKTVNHLSHFSHNDFMWGKTANELIFDKIITQMKQYS